MTLSFAWGRPLIRLVVGLLLPTVGVPYVARGEEPAAIRCAVIGGMTDTGFWPALAQRFRQETQLNATVVSTGPKGIIADSFIRGEADVVVMHASDTIINLVADGYGENPQPWARNDLLLVGPKNDPAGVRGERDVVVALRKIVSSNQRLLLHRSVGANEVMHDLLAAGNLEVTREQAIFLTSRRERDMLQQAARQQAYTLVGRIPYLNGKIPAGETQVMVRDDPRMRRPYLVVVATPARIGKERHAAATRLAGFLRAKPTQEWIATFGRGTLDEQPVFFPVVVDSTPTQEAESR